MTEADAEASKPGRQLVAFAVGLYGRPGVADACLLLQDGCGVNIPILLMAAWLAARGSRATPSLLEGAGETVGDWHREVVEPLRIVRRRLKSGPAPAPGRSTDEIRDVVKKAELSAEIVELTVLEEFALNQAFEAGRPDPVEAISTVVDFYRVGARESAHDEAIRTIAAAIQAG